MVFFKTICSNKTALYQALKSKAKNVIEKVYHERPDLKGKSRRDLNDQDYFVFMRSTFDSWDAREENEDVDTSTIEGKLVNWSKSVKENDKNCPRWWMANHFLAYQLQVNKGNFQTLIIKKGTNLVF